MNNNEAIILARVSSREQEEGYSIDAQLDRLRKYCFLKDLKCIEEFKITESSTKGERKLFYQMINFVKKRKSPVAIVCDKVDRLQRSFKEMPILDELRRSGKISLHFNTEGQILTKDSNSSQIMAYQMFIMMAESYTNNLSDNVRRSFEHMVTNEGKYPHRAMVGYVNARDELGKPTILIDSDMGWLITKIFKAHSTGAYSLAEITRRAKEWGFRTKSSKRTNTQTIRNVLSNRFYCGEMIHKGQYYAHQYETLIDAETFEVCQRILAGKMNIKKRKNQTLFQGLIKCQDCGGMISTDIKGKDGQYRYLF